MNLNLSAINGVRIMLIIGLIILIVFLVRGACHAVNSFLKELELEDQENQEDEEEDSYLHDIEDDSYHPGLEHND